MPNNYLLDSQNKYDLTTEAARMRVRRGYYGTHKTVMSDEQLKSVTIQDIERYRAKADKMDKSDSRSGVLWTIGFILFFGFILFGTGSPEPTANEALTPVIDSSSPADSPSTETDSSHESNSYEEYYEPSNDYTSSYDNYYESDYEYNDQYNASTDLDCADYGYEHYVGYDDPHGLDGDGDGWACESW